MRARWIMTGLLAGLVVAAPAWAQRVGLPAPEFQYELSEREDRQEFYVKDLRGRVALFFYWRSTVPEAMDAFPVIKKIVETYRTQGVVVASFTPEKRETGEAALRAQEIAFHWIGYGQPWLDTFEVVAVPYVYIIDPHGIVAWKGHPLDDLEARLKDVIKRTPPIGADRPALEAQLTKAEAALAKGEIGKAYTHVRRVVAVTEQGSDMHERAKGMIDRLVEAGKKWLSECRDAYRANEHEKACRIAAEVSVRFQTDEKEGPVRELVAEAETEIGRLRGDIRTKDMVGKAVDNARAELRVDEALEFEAQNDFVAAMRLYREVFDEFPKLAGGKAAKEALDRINSDNRLQARIRETRRNAQAERWYQIAERYRRVQMYAQAMELYQKITSEHPQSPAAAKAREAQRTLPRSGEGPERASADKP